MTFCTVSEILRLKALIPRSLDASSLFTMNLKRLAVKSQTSANSGFIYISLLSLILHFFHGVVNLDLSSSAAS